jgi:hypothetical protein
VLALTRFPLGDASRKHPSAAPQLRGRSLGIVLLGALEQEQTQLEQSLRVHVNPGNTQQLGALRLVEWLPGDGRLE